MKSSIRIAAFSILCAAALPALAQWAWRDENGRTVYSDRPPPATVKAPNIIRTPSGGVSSVGTTGTDDSNSAQKSDTKPTDGKASAAAPTGKAAAPAGPKSWAEQEMDFRKRQQEKADNEKKQLDAEIRAAKLSQDCARWKGYARMLENGTPVARPGEDGSRSVLNESQRSQELDRTREMISKNCDS